MLRRVPAWKPPRPVQECELGKGRETRFGMLTVTRGRVVVFAILVAVVAGLIGVRQELVHAAPPRQGVDVSSFQGSINWGAVASSGVSFAFIRAGEGTSTPDGDFVQNWNGATAAGLTVGAYQFFHPSEDPGAQATLLLQQLSAVSFGPGQILPAVDVETTDGLSPGQVAGALQVMVQDIQAAIGTLPAIYTAPSWWDGNVGSGAFTNDPLWVANWCSGCAGPSLPASNWGGNGWQVWQYTDNGSIPGISGSVDQDEGNPGLPLYAGATPPAVSGGVALRSDGKSGYSVDGQGHIAAFGGAPSVTSPATWPYTDIVRGIALRSDGTSGYVLDGYGGLHPFGGAPVLSNPSSWPGWDIARGVVLDADGLGGQILDGWGGLHPFGNATNLTDNSYWQGWDITRGIALDGDGKGGQILDGWGGLHAFGNASYMTDNSYWRGWDIARGVALLPSGAGGYVLDGYGGLHPVGTGTYQLYGAPYHGGTDSARGVSLVACGGSGGICVGLRTAAFKGTPAAAVAITNQVPVDSGGVALRSDGASGYAVDGFGTVTPFGGAPSVAQPTGWSGTDIARGIAVRPDGASGYVVDGYGTLHPFGNAPTLANNSFWQGWDIARGIVLDADGNGGQILDGYGGLHPFGNASTLSVTGYWSGWDIARGVALDSDGQGGQVLDGLGGIHQFGNAAGLSGSAYWSGWDIARAITLTPSGHGGYVLDGYGGLHPLGTGVAYVYGTPYHPNVDTGRGIAMATCYSSATCVAVRTAAYNGTPMSVTVVDSRLTTNEGGTALRSDGVSGYSVDEHGNIVAFGGAPAVTPSATWTGNMARGIALRSDGVSGYVLDAYGGLHPFGGAPTLATAVSWPGWDIARGIVLDSDGLGGQILDGWGGVHPFGNAAALSVTGYWQGWDIARGLALMPSNSGGYVIDGYGGVHPFGNAPSISSSSYWYGWDIARGIALLPSGTGGYLLDGFGGLHAIGTAPYAATPIYTGTDNVRAVAVHACSGATACGAVQALGGLYPNPEQSTGTFRVP